MGRGQTTPKQMSVPRITAEPHCVSCGSSCELVLLHSLRLFCAECLLRATQFNARDPYDELGGGGGGD
jgi:hypothetical protein